MRVGLIDLYSEVGFFRKDVAMASEPVLRARQITPEDFITGLIVAVRNRGIRQFRPNSPRAFERAIVEMYRHLEDAAKSTGQEMPFSVRFRSTADGVVTAESLVIDALVYGILRRIRGGEIQITMSDPIEHRVIREFAVPADIWIHWADILRRHVQVTMETGRRR